MKLTQLIEVYDFARKAHEGQTDKGGKPYILHPIAVAQIVQNFGGDETTIYASLLHDVVEDTPVKLEEIEAKFGKDVAFLVDGVTKTDTFEGTLEKVAKYTEKDKRVLLIKLADKAHNLGRTVPGEKIKDLAKYMRKQYEATDFYAKLGLKNGFTTLAKTIKDLGDNLKKKNGHTGGV